ncbi:ring-opening amidohydrolase [Actinomadura sp. NBRC 104425]|nr:ring-opening amidohydrolase [Actinomadura sp. NBRC 104425]
MRRRSGRLGHRDPAVFVSLAAVHQGPFGGGTVAAIADLGPR